MRTPDTHTPFTELESDQIPSASALRQPDGHIWVFAYGSLIWNPELDYDRRIIARVEGLVRDFALKSVVLRGTTECPGRVLGLRPPVCQTEFCCIGAAYRLRLENEEESLLRLWEREMTIGAYTPILANLESSDSSCLHNIKGLTFMVSPDNLSYVAPASADVVAEIVRGASGERGANTDYVVETAKALKELGLCDPHIEAVATLLESP